MAGGRVQRGGWASECGVAGAVGVQVRRGGWAGGAGRGWTPPKPKRAPAQKQEGRPGFGERGIFF